MRVWHRGQPDGQEVDLDAYLRFAADRRAGGGGTGADTLYREMRSGARDLACLLLADLSLSTDTWIDDRARVIDAIRDSLFLFAESLAVTGDRFGILGFILAPPRSRAGTQTQGIRRDLWGGGAGAHRCREARLLHTHGSGAPVRHQAAHKPAGGAPPAAALRPSPTISTSTRAATGSRTRAMRSGRRAVSAAYHSV